VWERETNPQDSRSTTAFSERARRGFRWRCPNGATRCSKRMTSGGHAASLPRRVHFRLARTSCLQEQAGAAIHDRSLEGNVHECRRKNVVSFPQSVVKYPFENALAALPWRTISPAQRFVIKPVQGRFPEPSNLREWLLAPLATASASVTSFPITKSLEYHPVESFQCSGRLHSKSDPEDILSPPSVRNGRLSPQLYYHYPRRAVIRPSPKRGRSVPVTYNFGRNR